MIRTIPSRLPLFLAYALCTALGAADLVYTPVPDHSTGARPATADERAGLEDGRNHSVSTLALDELGLSRLNAERATRGMTVLSAAGIASASSLPTSIDNSATTWFPAIGDQGRQGSCVSWGVTYCALTYEVCRLKNWTASTVSAFSPKWTYNMINGGVDNGSSIVATVGVLRDHGAATLAQLPYNQYDYLAWSTDPLVWKSALRWKLADYTWITNGQNSTGIQLIKTALANGHVLPFATYINSWQVTTLGNDPATTTDDTIAGQAVCAYQSGTSGGHVMAIVGYNDDLWCDINGNGVVDPGEKGAFKVANSWGTSVWNNGFVWVSYDAFYATSQVSPAPVQTNRMPLLQDSNYSCCYLTARDYTPTLYVKVDLTHTKREQISISLSSYSYDSSTSASASLPYFAIYAGPYNFSGGTASSTATFYFDGTGILDASGTSEYDLWVYDYQWIYNASSNSWTHSLTADGAAVQIGNFSIESPDGARSLSSLYYPSSQGQSADGNYIVAYTIWQDPYLTSADYTTPYSGTTQSPPVYIGHLDSWWSTSFAYKYTNQATGAVSTTAPKDAGTYQVQTTLNYYYYYYSAQATANSLLTITQAPLRIQADDKTITSGALLPTLTATYRGLQGNDTTKSITGTPILSTTARAGDPSGSYPITINISGMSSNNYAMTGINGTLVISNTGNTWSAASNATGEGGGCGLGSGVAGLGLGFLLLMWCLFWRSGRR